MTAQPDLAGVSFASGLARHGNAPAVLLPGARMLTYRDLARRVDDVMHTLGPVRRLVALEASNSVATLTAYLAALAGGHPLIVLPAGKRGERSSAPAIIDAYEPDVVLRSAPGDEFPLIDERHPGTRHDLHPDLALLASTSGSTGSPKLVRLSAAGVEANAGAIAEYLHLRPGDRAATTLPFSYCYGLSVVNSHLSVGAALALTDLSVVDPCFWDLAREHRVTSFAAVPYTFELLERVGFEQMDLPHLRYITQAGGRLDPERVRHYAQLGRRRGWDLFVMYGQTEATARMAYLPPDLASDHPTAIGVPIPGGSFRLEAVDGLDERELVYSGPNVMLGYAESPADLALGRTVHELRTGDLARRTDAGLYEIVGRRSRFVKIVGLRVDLGRVERMLADDGAVAAAAGTDELLVVAIESGTGAAGDGAGGSADDGALRLAAKDLAVRLGLPRAAVMLRAVESIPRLANGKTDYKAVLSLADEPPRGRPAANASPIAEGRPGEPHTAESHTAARRAARRTESPADVARIYAETLEIEAVRGEDTFVSLGGDSLSYVAASVRLEAALGTLPAHWHLVPVSELSRSSAPAVLLGEQRPAEGEPTRRAAWRRRARAALDRGVARTTAPMETGIVVRAIAIVLIAGTHIDLFVWPGTAHVLFVLAGFNFARFQLTGDRRTRLKSQTRSLVRILVPSLAVIWLAFFVTGEYTVHNLFLVHAIFGLEGYTGMSRFWFIEELVYVLLAVMALLAIPRLDALQRRYPWAFPMVLFGFALLTRFGILPVIPHQGPVLWLFALGWATAVATTSSRRWLLTILTVMTVPGFFENEYRNATIIGGILLLVWLPTLRVPRGLTRVIAVLASSSLYIYVSHWLVFPYLVRWAAGFGIDTSQGSWFLAVALAASLAVGTGYWAIATRAMASVECRLGGRRVRRVARRVTATRGALLAGAPASSVSS